MSATENATNNVVAVEPIVNRWIVDYYYCLALELLKQKKYVDFRNICSVVDSILNRQMEEINNLSLKIRLLQFLSRLNEAEKPEQQFEADRTITPLESALDLLELITGDFRIPQRIGDNACISLREFIVGTFIKNNQFEKAKDALIQHFPKSMGGKREMFMNLISRKSKAHDIIKQISLQRLMEEMLDFCQKVCPFAVPFMCKAARSLVEKRPENAEERAATSTGEQNQSTSSCSPQINIFNLQLCKHSIIQRARLEVAFNALAGGSTEMSFVQLEEEIKHEAQEKEDACLQLTAEADLNSEQEAGFQRDTRSPMEASPADQLPQPDTDPQTPSGSLSRYTVSRLVIGPDSQQSSQSTTNSEELRIEMPPQTLTSNDLNDMQCPVADAEVPVPTRKRLRKSSPTGSSCLSLALTERSSDYNEESVHPAVKKTSNVEDVDHRSSRSSNRDGSKSKQSSSGVKDGPEESSTPLRTSQHTLSKSPARCSSASDPGEVEDISIMDSSLDSSPSVSSRHSAPQGTPHKRPQAKVPLNLGWKQSAKEAKESKETWSDEELYFISTKNTATGSRSNKSTISNSGNRKKAWTAGETEKLKEGVKKFGEGKWNKIKSYYSFDDRTNVNLKDRWRTLKKSNLV